MTESIIRTGPIRDSQDLFQTLSGISSAGIEAARRAELMRA